MVVTFKKQVQLQHKSSLLVLTFWDLKQSFIKLNFGANLHLEPEVSFPSSAACGAHSVHLAPPFTPPPPPVPHSSLWCTWGVTGLSELLCAPAASACVPTGVGVCARMHVHVCTLPMHQLQPEIMEGAQGLQGFALTQAIHRLSIAQLIQHLVNSAHINCSADQRRSAVMKGRGGDICVEQMCAWCV